MFTQQIPLGATATYMNRCMSPELEAEIAKGRDLTIQEALEHILTVSNQLSESDTLTKTTR